MIVSRLSGRILVFLALACGSCGPAESSEGPADDAQWQGPVVVPGASVLLADSFHLVRNLRVGLITNHTGLIPPDRPGLEPRTLVDRLHTRPDVELVALFAPEHGLRGDAEAGAQIESGRDPITGLPVHSLYSDTRTPPPESLDGIDALLFDIQDVGARYYTYVYTMALAMEDAGRRGIPFIVLDRPNPIDGAHVQGNVLDPAYASFVGMYAVPMRHGMTAGELARLYVGEFGIDVSLRVVPANGWIRSMPFGETGLPWVPPSPNIPDVTSALHYPGTCLFEGTNLSVGRGTDAAFQWIGAPWLDGPTLAARLEARGLRGVRFEPVTFTPRAPGDGKFDGEEVHGVRFIATDVSTYDPTVAAVAALLEARRMSGVRWSWRTDHFDRLAGTDRLRLAVEEGRSLDEIVGPWAPATEAFRILREPYLLYP
jgi:uncharacterized protein YbbC (DUF1343 family)